MAVTWTIATLERNTDDGVVVAHWRASDSEVVGTGDDAVTHSGSSYGTAGFTPDADAEGYVAYADLTEEAVVEWVKADVDADSIEASIASQIEESKAPAISTGTPW
jgi:hypothetical protein|tara:strand:+ start:78 stop:395 length:318 start_codon:yes stop_codon:yes gene_type:complete